MKFTGFVTVTPSRQNTGTQAHACSASCMAQATESVSLRYQRFRVDFDTKEVKVNVKSFCQTFWVLS